jgi:hypothetical protein
LALIPAAEQLVEMVAVQFLGVAAQAGMLLVEPLWVTQVALMVVAVVAPA